MLSEADVEERARYCYCVLMQLSWLYSNDNIEPSQYLEWLKTSSLGLGTDEFITLTVEDALLQSREDGGLLTLISLYEGFAHAFCQVLERELDDVKAEIDPGMLRQLAGEMGVELENL
ncbi:MAG: hypothetical protein LLG06_03435 [Desulfobacteraceae bacterium]|nr:hypothetical protein [Desulfobacteraceae bacterium]